MLDSALGEPSVKHVDSSNSLPTRHPVPEFPDPAKGSPTGLVPSLSFFKIT